MTQEEIDAFLDSIEETEREKFGLPKVEKSTTPEPPYEFKKKVLFAGDKYSGVDIAYVKSRKMLSMSGWYDSGVGIKNTEVPLAEFLSGLGITLADCKKALEEEKE